MSKKATITFSDEYALQGAKRQAAAEGKTFSQYVTELVEADLQNKLQYKIVAYYESGDTHTETQFYTEADLDESIFAYSHLYCKHERTYKGDLLTGYEVWKHGKLVKREGATK